MGVILVGKKLFLEGGKKYNKFMYKNDLLEKKNAPIDAKLCRVNAKLEKKAEDKMFKKEEKKKMKQIPSNRKFEFHIPSFFKDSGVEDSEETQIYFYDKEDNSYQGDIIDAKSFLDKDLKSVSKITGKELLSRDYEKDALYVKDENSDILRILSAKKVNCDGQDEDERFILIETKYEYFVVKFVIELNF